MLRLFLHYSPWCKRKRGGMESKPPFSPNFYPPKYGKSVKIPNFRPLMFEILQNFCPSFTRAIYIFIFRKKFWPPLPPRASRGMLCHCLFWIRIMVKLFLRVLWLVTKERFFVSIVYLNFSLIFQILDHFQHFF